MLATSLMVVGTPPMAVGQSPTPGLEEYTIPEGTEFRLVLHTAINSVTSNKEDKILTSLVEPVYVYDRAILPKGLRVEGRVEEVEPAGPRGRGGYLSIRFDTIELPSGEKVPISGSLAEIYWSEKLDNIFVDVEGNLKGEGPSRLLRVAIVAGAAAAGGVAGVAAGIAVGVGGLVGAIWLSRGKEATLEPGALIGMRLDRDARISLPVGNR